MDARLSEATESENVEANALFGNSEDLLAICGSRSYVFSSVRPQLSGCYHRFVFLDKEILRQYPPETHTPRAEAPRRATQRERL
jgi:hypothetical protein